MRPLDTRIPDPGQAETTDMQARENRGIGRLRPAPVARLARLEAGVSLQEAAKAINVQPAYLARLEREQCFPEYVACQLARIYRCGLDRFLCYVFRDQDTEDGAETKKRGRGQAGPRPRR